MLFFQSTTDSHCRKSSESPKNRDDSVIIYNQTKHDKNWADGAPFNGSPFQQRTISVLWYHTVVMYREWKSGASFRKARPACEFTTSWKNIKSKISSPSLSVLARLPHFHNKSHKTTKHKCKRTTPGHAVAAVITKTWYMVLMSTSILHLLSGMSSMANRMCPYSWDRAHDVQI